MLTFRSSYFFAALVSLCLLSVTQTVDAQSYCRARGYSHPTILDTVEVGGTSIRTWSRAYRDHSRYQRGANKQFEATQGEDLAFTLTARSPGSYPLLFWGVYIDFNQDGRFDRWNEALYWRGVGPYKGRFPIPESAKAGETRMRVVMMTRGFPRPCGGLGNAAINDFSIVIKEPESTVRLPKTAIYWNSAPQHRAGQGIEDVFLPEDGQFNVDLTRNFAAKSGVHAAFRRNSDHVYFGLHFDANGGEVLKTGYYGDTTSVQINSNHSHGLTAYSTDNYCSSETGHFNVIEARFKPDTSEVLSFAARFSHYCDRPLYTHRLDGVVYYNFVATPQACKASSERSSHLWIAGVAVGDFENYGNITRNVGYRDLTQENTYESIELEPGSTVSATLRPGFLSSSSNAAGRWSIWLDVNGDGDFNDPNELLYSHEGVKTGSTTVPIAIPAELSSKARLRIKLQANAPVAEPCGSIRQGQIHDYTVIPTGWGAWEGNPVDECRLDHMNGDNITRASISTEAECLDNLCDIYGPANAANRIPSHCVFRGAAIKTYDDWRNLCRFDRENGVTVSHIVNINSEAECNSVCDSHAAQFSDVSGHCIWRGEKIEAYNQNNTCRLEHPNGDLITSANVNSPDQCLSEVCEMEGGMLAEEGRPSQCVWDGEVLAKYGNEADICRLDRLSGSNITRRNVSTEADCLSEVCDAFGPPNASNGVPSECKWKGEKVKAYGNPADTCRLEYPNGDTITRATARSEEECLDSVCEMNGSMNAENGIPSQCVYEGQVVARYGNEADMCRLDLPNGRNITRRAIYTKVLCEARLCDRLGPANASRRIPSKCVFKGKETKTYGNENDICRLDRADNGQNITRLKVDTKEQCLSQICDMYGPANAANGTASNCIWTGRTIKEYES